MINILQAILSGLAVAMSIALHRVNLKGGLA